ncbi:MAG TPA: C25 family cysteine peptidase, partial [Acidobacteriota bacterium]|nr:C25 family cysteine peptidase [Acidobacteriota bacterium]
LLTGGVWTGAAAPFTLTFEDSAGAGARPRYALLSTARAAAPASIRLHAPPAGPRTIADLLDPANEADYVVIAPPAFHAAAESLAAERSAYLEGIAAPSAKVVTSDRVFAQFGGGTPDPTAIRNFLAYAARHWARAPLYVCLLGDASGDPLNYSGFQVADLLPAHANGYDNVLGEQFVMDDWLVRLDGPTDQLLDMAVGRLPARTAAEALDQVRGKRRLYERNGDFDLGRNRALFSADDSWKWSNPQQQDLVGLDHTRQLERKDRFHLPFPVTRAKVYVNDYAFADSSKTSKPGAREAFIAAASRGNWLVDYVGHGSGTLLADEQILRAVDATRLTNASLPSLWAFMSCTVGRFDDYRQDGLAELLLRQPSGGAAIALAASQEVFGVQSADLNDDFLDELFPASPRVDTLVTAGLAWARAKNRAVNFSVRKYNYLGEPGLRPPLPRGRGVWEKAPLDSLLRGEQATLRGHAIGGDGTLDTTASGTARLRILGPPSRRVLNGFQGGNPGVAVYNLPGPVLYEGETSLDRGTFEITFTVPVDGRVSGAGARLEALLEEAGGKGVGLAADSLIIGAGLAPRVDVQPPSISLLAPPDTIFAAGDRVTIALEDSSGIDLTRFDNAHAIFALFDDAGLPIDLTAAFRYERGSATRGTVELVFPALAEGAHRLEVHASDTYRNIAVATFVIEIAPKAGPGEALDLSQVFNYPNPFANETYLHVRLNQPARLKITILTVAGRRVRSWNVEGRAGENYIPWDGRDSRGEITAIGVYLIHVTADAPGGGRVDAVAKALRTR